MNEIKATIKSSAVFSDDQKHRVLLRREWDKTKPTAMVLMINPSSSALVHTDMTTLCILNNLEKLDYGSVEITNMYSEVTNKISFRFSSDEELLHEENDKYIIKSAESAQAVVIAWGTIGENNRRVRKRQYEILKALEPYAHKLMCICDHRGHKVIHPLTPSVRNEWLLEAFPYKAWMNAYHAEEKAEADAAAKQDRPTKAGKKAKNNLVTEESSNNSADNISTSGEANGSEEADTEIKEIA